MRQCVECQGLVPVDADACPNCNLGRRGNATFKKVLVAVSLGVTSITACMPYGVPPCPDGTSNCYDPCHSSSNTRQTDGGLTANDPVVCPPADGGQP
ncbi:MAG TPA: hypothetical protein VGD87_16515 [Archangium sp.]